MASFSFNNNTNNPPPQVGRNPFASAADLRQRVTARRHQRQQQQVHYAQQRQALVQQAQQLQQTLLRQQRQAQQHMAAAQLSFSTNHRHGVDTFPKPVSAGKRHKSMAHPFTGTTNQEALDQQGAQRVPAKRPPKPVMPDGTRSIPYQATLVDEMQDETDARLVSICAMPVYADKSPEELRMEDYLKRPGGSAESHPQPSDKNDTIVNPQPPPDPVDLDDDAMEMESQKDEMEHAIDKATSFLQVLLTELSDSKWSDLKSVVTLHHTVLLEHLVRFFLKREEWRNDDDKRRLQLSVGYHYTTPNSVAEILKHGVLTKADREKAGVTENFSASALGDGVYTGNRPTDFYKFRRDATVGVMVLRLFHDVGCSETLDEPRHDTIVMRRSHARVRNGDTADYVNLRNSAQCAILASFDGGSAPVNRLLDLQTCVEECLDRVLVDDEAALKHPSPSPKKNPSVSVKVLDCQKELYRKNECRKFTIEYSAPQTLGTDDANRFFAATSDTNLEPGQECAICLDTLSGDRLFRIKGCKHVFHEECMEMINTKFSHCPVCRFYFKKPHGQMPDGRMTVRFDPVLTCDGNVKGTIKIDYNIWFGIQKNYHENRGIMFPGTTRAAYIPDNKEGRQLLRRLMYAFLHGLTFRIGTSLTTGRPNSVTWAIHHKSSTERGPHGFPDASYFDSSNDDLSSYGVPKADSPSLRLPELTAIDRYVEWRDRFTQT